VHALHRREELLRSAPTPAALRRGWIAYPQYWGQTLYSAEQNADVIPRNKESVPGSGRTDELHEA
jgi:hypothetical protein